MQQLVNEVKHSEEILVLEGVCPKITRVRGLDHLPNLVILNLRDNLIGRIENMSHLSALRVLNLEFNQVGVLENLEGLLSLQQLLLSYNRIQTISRNLHRNSKIRVLSISFNEIAYLRDVTPIFQLHNLVLLSIQSNPFIEKVNYLSVMKAMIKSLVRVDGRDVNEEDIMHFCQLQPQEQIFVLKQTVDKLLDQRTHFISQLNQAKQESLDFDCTSKCAQSLSEIELNREKVLNIDETIRSPQKKYKNEGNRLIQILQFWEEKMQKQIDRKKEQLRNLTEQYTQHLRLQKCSEKNSYHQDFLDLQAEMLSIVNELRRHKQQPQNESNACKRLKLQTKLLAKQEQLNRYLRRQEKEKKAANSREYKRKEGSRRLQNSNNSLDSKEIIQRIKRKEGEIMSIRTKMNQLNMLRQELMKKPQDVYKTLFFQILFGRTDGQQLESCEGLRECLISPIPLFQLFSKLKTMIFGQEAGCQEIQDLQRYLKGRSFLEIGYALKQQKNKHKKRQQMFDSECQNVTAKLKAQADQICFKWREVKEAEKLLQKEREALQTEQMQFDSNWANREKEIKAKSQKLEEECLAKSRQARQRAQQVVREQQKQEMKLIRMQEQQQELQQRLERKWKELEEFQECLESFKQSKEEVRCMSGEIQLIEADLQNKKALLSQLQNSLDELQAAQIISRARLQQSDRKVQELRSELLALKNEIYQSESKLQSLQRQNKNNEEELEGLKVELEEKKRQEKELSKGIERAKSSLQLYQDKLRNLGELQNSKQASLVELQKRKEQEKTECKQLKATTTQLEQKLQSYKLEHHHLQAKVNESKSALDALAGANEAITHLLERQALLKRQNLDLQINNQRLRDTQLRLEAQIQLYNQEQYQMP